MDLQNSVMLFTPQVLQGGVRGTQGHEQDVGAVSASLLVEEVTMGLRQRSDG